MKCLIIAGGIGSRLKHRGEIKPLIPLLGLPILERSIKTLKACGIEDFYIVTGYKHEKFHPFLEDLTKKEGVRITSIINSDWEKENGYSVYQARNHLKDSFLLLMADHLFDQEIIRLMKDQLVHTDEVLLAVDHNITNHYVNPHDATRVLVQDRRIIEIGKGIGNFNGYDTGIFLCTPVIFKVLKESIDKGNTTLTGAVRLLAQKGKVRAVDITGRFWVDIDDEETFRKAEKYLQQSLSKPSDGPISRYLNRPISRRITSRLVRTRITPNQVSIVSFLISIVAAILFFLRQPFLLALGGVVAQISSILDGCDGELARLRSLESRSGGWLDSILDRYGDGLLLAGLTYYLAGNNPDVFPLLIGLLALIGSFLNSYIAVYYDRIRNERFRIGRDLRLFIIFISAVLNQPLAGLFAIGLIMNLENLRRIVQLLKYG